MPSSSARPFTVSGTDSGLVPQALRCVVMGVSGCGKSAIGQALADALGVRFVEGDTFHPAQNVAKMRAGIPLTDADRAGWLARLRDEIAACRRDGQGAIVSCSALKRRYRDVLREGDPQLAFLHLDGDRALLARRMQARPGHYMPVSLLDSQIAALEPLGADENGARFDIDAAPDQIVAKMLAFLRAPARR